MSKSAVETFLKNANRPHSLNDVQQGLPKEHGKSAIQKALDQLVADGRITEKLYGKQKIYCCAQPDDSNQDTENIDSLDQQIRQTEEEFSDVDAQVKKVEAELKTLASTMSTAEAKAENERLSTENEFLRCNLMRLEKANLMISEEDRLRVHETLQTSITAYRKRKRICMDVLDQILENYPKPKKHLYQEIGIEDDNASGMPAFQLGT